MATRIGVVNIVRRQSGRQSRPSRVRPRSLLLHVSVLLALSAACAVVLGTALWLALGRPALTVRQGRAAPTPTTAASSASSASPAVPVLSTSDRLESVKLVLATVGGIGAVVALTVAYRRQRDSEIAEYREDTRLFTDRFGRAADQLGSDHAAVRVAGVYAVAELADDWDEGRQMCIDVLCAYLRMPYDPDQHRDGDREVRRTTIRVIRNHLRPGWSAVSWSTYRFSFEGAVFDCGDLSGARFLAPGLVTFHSATFVSGSFEFHRVVFGAPTWFTRVHFAGAKVGFSEARFAFDKIPFDDTVFAAGTVDFRQATVASGSVTFAEATVLPAAVIEWGPFPPVPVAPAAAAAANQNQSRRARLPSPRRSRRRSGSAR